MEFVPWSLHGAHLADEMTRRTMKSQPVQSVAHAGSKAIDHYFECALYLLVVSGFATLASTGGLDLLSLVFVTVALAVRGYLLFTCRNFVVSDRWTTPLTLAYFAFFAADYFVVSDSFLPATVHLALFGVVVRMFSLRRERDYIMLAVLSFAIVLAAAILTVDSLFLLCFAFFTLMAVATFILLEMRRSGRAATLQPLPSSDPQENRGLAVSLARVVPSLVLLILIAATALFFLLPRRSGGYLGGYSFGTDFSSGFSDHVQLGQIGQIQQSNAVVMHVQIDGDRTGRYSLRWRGVALGDFDGHTWSKPRSTFPPLQRWPDNSFSIPPLEKPAAQVTALPTLAGEKTIHYRVLMEPIGTSVFFLAPWARDVSGNYQVLAADSGGAVYNLDTQHAISRYEADSNIAAPTATELRSAGTNYPADIRQAYLGTDGVDPRVSRLAAQVTASPGTDFDKAAALENYLRTRYQYTLELPRTAPADPIANFLFERKKGHCEYFASSMAVMLRTLGIPSRVVNGFRSDEFNDLTGNYVVRARDAHAWVEAYFPRYGWQTFDPTPGGGASIPQGWARLALYVDAMSSFWRDWIVSYDTSHQYVIGQTALTRTQNLWEGARTWAQTHYASMLEWARQTQDRAQHAPAKWILAVVSLSLLFLLLRNLGRIARLVQEFRLSAHPERSPEQAAAIWYARTARDLAQRGMHKSNTETPREFLRRIDDQGLREPVARFTESYESARFGNSAEDAGHLPKLYAEVQSASRAR